MCKFTFLSGIERVLMCVDDPELFSSQPVCLQIVGFPFKDEELIATAETIDMVVN
jgi:Asp-tRNA(Asn)/Glu-tRNA(Gln) amidotransferase A subunit family amidase